jgi:predicted ATPase
LTFRVNPAKKQDATCDHAFHRAGDHRMHLNSATIESGRFPDIDRYPFNLELLRQTDRLSFTTPVTFFLGENGSGKSTLLQAIARRCNIMIWHGDRRPRADYNPHEEALYRFISVDWAANSVPGSYFASQIFRNFAQILDEWASTDPGLLAYFGGESLMTQSHGQSLMAFFRSRLKIKGIYFLDEPETALSPRSQLDLLSLLTKLSRTGIAQFIIATHSPILMACPGSTIYNFDHLPVATMRYRDTEHYRVYRDFMADPGKFIRAAE